MFLLVLITILFYQGPIMFNTLPQQYLFFVLLFLLRKRNVPDIKLSDEQDARIIFPEKDHLRNNSQNKDENIFMDDEEPIYKCNAYKTQKTNHDATFCAVNNNDEPRYETLNFNMNSCANRHHYYDTKIYHNKKHTSSKNHDMPQNTSDDFANMPLENKELEINTHFKSGSREKNPNIKTYEHNEGNLQHNKKIPGYNGKTDPVVKENKDIDDLSKLISDSGDGMSVMINKFGEGNKEQCTSTSRKEKVCIKKKSNDKNAVLNVIKKKELGKTVSIIFGDFGLITGTVIFSCNNITGLKLQNGIEIYLNNNDIKGYY